MEINLAAKNNDVKDNYPAWDPDLHFKSIKNKIQQQKKCIDDDSAIAQYHQHILQPGQWYHLVLVILLPVLHLYIP